MVYVSAVDGQLYAVRIRTGVPRRVSNDHGPRFSLLPPRGLARRLDARLHRVACEGGRPVVTNVWTIPTAGGEDVQLTDDAFPDDGSEFSPDGEWIYFNSERGSTTPGHAQLFRMRAGRRGIEQLSDDERVNWFPHLSPDGQRIAYISFPPRDAGSPREPRRDPSPHRCGRETARPGAPLRWPGHHQRGELGTRQSSSGLRRIPGWRRLSPAGIPHH